MNAALRGYRPGRSGYARTWLGALALAGLLLVLVPGPAGAGPDDVANAVSQKVMSPFCPGLTLHDCPSDAAADLRENIAGWARAGMTEGEIIDRLEREFGPGILATPPKEGTGLIAWLLPIAGLLGAIAVGVLLAKRWTRSSRSEGAASDMDMDPNDRLRLDAELREIRDQA